MAGGNSCAVKPLCPPTDGRVGFFSKGDCVLARAPFFQGHELLSYFGNRDLPPSDRFTDEEVQLIADGNRRVDWPIELLVHLNNGVAAYASAIVEHTNQPEMQRMHFLLTDKNNSAEAAADSIETILELTREATSLWVENRDRALTLIGQANHVLQDSFSPAHTVRNPEEGWCIEKVKAYIPRAEGYLTSDIEFHGSHDDTIGHITTEDSIYKEGRSCLDPQSLGAKEACLSEFATAGRLATRDYLAAVRRIVTQSRTSGAGGASSSSTHIAETSEQALAEFVTTHLSLCTKGEKE